MLHHKSMEEAIKLSRQLERMLPSIGSTVVNLPRVISPPSESESAMLRQVIAAGLLDRVARKMSTEQVRLMRRIRGARGWPYEACSQTFDEPVFIHHHSFVHDPDPKKST